MSALATRPRRLIASPLARRIAHVQGIDLAALSGSGPNGRIVRRDVEAAVAAAPPAAAAALAAPAASVAPPSPAAVAAAPAPSGRGDSTLQPLTRLQQTVARRMAEAKATVPEFLVETRVAMDAAVALRTQLKAAAEPGRAPSFNDLVVKACALALRDHPRANGSYTSDGFELHERVSVGLAVAADDALVVPVIADADRLPLGEIAREARRLATAVREGTIAPADLAGGTFTVSNLGMFGVTRFQAIVNPPQAAILAVGALRQEPVVRDGALALGHVMDLALTCDHRILYGADGARFLARVRELLERPLSLLL
ncbi:dihydrolipoamide acetyltransferase family protein [Conexibacter woesei]|uniref:Catalytic domain of components of various dehydrogenase complexes n=1 Tax=Conexibacter woesei (strain DSM 14684 / CCUG 47730 / CIP 108061 / JCM 11494 / NBRC 100937 / ID131577) TaxID=469383 RepID=D3F9V8_CONWI|nr:dihydrolipoamide acetyltransferase family protein [Conexibacter woesei]ADB51170.1 catalytic domain of components of various dehydrogenase complexes [Conexibacter woesei DSM 14684]